MKKFTIFFVHFTETGNARATRMLTRGDDSSANPQAIISSRLKGYLKRPWTALSPCPLAKTLIPSHPRRIYFYLTNQPHQPLPAFSSESPLPSSRRALISPSISSDDDQEARKRAALSPSPEIDLSSGQLELEVDAFGEGSPAVAGADPATGPPTPAGSFAGRSSLGREGSQAESVEIMSQRAASPPLEGDEREFTRTASAMQSKRSQSVDRRRMVSDDVEPSTIRTSIEDVEMILVDPNSEVEQQGQEQEHTEERRRSEAAAALFGHAPPIDPNSARTTMTTNSDSSMSTGSSGSISPLVRASTELHISPSMNKMSRPTNGVMTDVSLWSKGRAGDVESSSRLAITVPDLTWAGDLQSPETVELEELEDLLGEC